MLSRHHFEFSLLMKVALIVFTSTFVLCKDITDAVPQLRNFTENSSRVLSVLPSARANPCDDATASNAHFQSYFSGMDSIYPPQLATQTCLPIHKKCGWPRTQSQQLPMFVFSVGLEGAGHHLWTEIMNAPVFDCVWINGRHYNRIIGDGVPRTTVENLKEGINEQFQLRKAAGKPPCRSIFDAEDSFPTGAIRKSGRVFMRPDIINLQKLDGVMMNVKYLLILRNTTVWHTRNKYHIHRFIDEGFSRNIFHKNVSFVVYVVYSIVTIFLLRWISLELMQDTVLSSLRRNFFSHVDQGLRTVEHSLSYMEAAMRGYATREPPHAFICSHTVQLHSD